MNLLQKKKSNISQYRYVKISQIDTKCDIYFGLRSLLLIIHYDIDHMMVSQQSKSVQSGM